MSNAFDGLLCSLDDCEERINELEDWPIETSHSGMKSEKTEKHKLSRTSQNYGTISKRSNINIRAIPGEEERLGQSNI